MKAEMFKAEMLHHQLQQMEQELKSLDEKVAEIHSLKAALTEFQDVPGGEELLIPVARGIFTKATSSTEKKFYVNVGDGTVVEKDLPSVITMLDTQLTAAKKIQKDIHNKFNQALEELQKMEQEMK